MEEIFKTIKETLENVGKIISEGVNRSLYGVVYDEKKHGKKARKDYRYTIRLLSYDYRQATRDEVIDAEALEVYTEFLSYGFKKADMREVGRQFAQGKIKIREEQK